MVNKKYKDGVFRFLFNDKKEALELYNILYGTNYTNPEDVELVTLEDVLFTARKNDLAFLVKNKFVVLMEHQSTINENMPLRFLLYVSRLYEKLLNTEKIYKRSLISIPTPEFTVLYNGQQNLCIGNKKVKEKTLKLSNAFFNKQKQNSLELIVRVIDIRYSTQHETLNKQSTLKEYSQFVELVETHKKKEKDKKKAYKKAIEEAISSGILKDFLTKHSSEVLNMLTLEYNAEIEKKVLREEALEEGREKGIKEGIKEGREEVIIQMIKSGLTNEQIAKFTKLSLEEIEQLRNKL